MIKLTNNTWQYVIPSVKELRNIAIELIPYISKSSLNLVDSDSIDKVRSLPLYNGLEDTTISNLYIDILQMIQFLGAFQRFKSMDEIYTIIKNIHTSMAHRETPADLIPKKGATNIKNWVKYLRALHPNIDAKMKNDFHFYFFRDISEHLGTWNILHSTDTNTIDPNAWGNGTELAHNRISRTTQPYFAPSYIREQLREKIDSDTAQLIQNANTTCSVNMQRNIVSETWKTTAPIMGNEMWQIRPVYPELTQGAHLNADWYHWTYRVMLPLIGLKEKGQMDVIDYLNSYYAQGDFTVHTMVNHLCPMKPFADSEKYRIEQSESIGVEETFPTKLSTIVANRGHNSQPIQPLPTKINNSVLKPEIIT